MPKTNWTKIKNDYIFKGLSCKKLSEKYNISQSSIEKRSSKEKWKELREEKSKIIEEKVQEKTQNKIIDRNTRHLALIDKGYDIVERVLNDELCKTINMFGKVVNTGIVEDSKFERIINVLSKLQKSQRVAEGIMDEYQKQKLELEKQKLNVDVTDDELKVIIDYGAEEDGE